jgi:hypothetical protein
MSEERDERAGSNWKSKTLLAGAVLGALVGLGAAYLLVQRAESEDGEMHMGAGEGVKLGLLVFGLLRQVAQLGEGGK